MAPGQYDRQITITVNPDPGPVVNAGANQTIKLPAEAAVSGTVTESPLPPGATLTSTWTLTSGPGTVMFGDPMRSRRRASFSTTGTYVLQLAGSDGIAPNTSTVIIIVNPPALPGPLVSAGSNQSFNYPYPVTLSGSVSETGATPHQHLEPDQRARNGHFRRLASPATTATFNQPGTYVLQLDGSRRDLYQHRPDHDHSQPRPRSVV